MSSDILHQFASHTLKIKIISIECNSNRYTSILFSAYKRKKCLINFHIHNTKNYLSEISAKMKSLSDEKNQVTRTFFYILNTDKNGCQCKLGIHEETVIVLYYSKFMISDFHLAISAIYRQKDQTIEKRSVALNYAQKLDIRCRTM